jgi:hypothetical protein
MSGAGATWSTAGKNGNALSLSGTATGMVTVPSSVSLGLTSSHTFESWVKPTTVTGIQTIFIKELTNGCTYWVQLNGSRITTGFNNGSGCVERMSTTQTIPVNQWSHIAAVFDDTANNYKIYLNGNLVSTIAETRTPATSTNPLVFGQSGYAGGQYERWHGLIDDVRIYNRALTATEIQTDMNTAL